MSVCLLYGCAAVIIGAGIGAGAFAYKKGRLVRIYRAGYHETVRAGMSAMTSLRIPVKDNIGDELKTDIFAERPDGTPVRIEVKRLGPDRTEVGVRTGSLGVLEEQTSRQIHDQILHQLEGAGGPAAAAVISQVDAASELEQQEDMPRSQGRQNNTTPTASPADGRDRLKPRWPDHLTLSFDSDSTHLSEEATGKLDRLVRSLQGRNEYRLLLEGYSDGTGNREYNKMISESRSVAAKMYLVAKGVDPERVDVVGRGATDFIAGNDTGQGRRLNRRVEIHFRAK